MLCHAVPWGAHCRGAHLGQEGRLHAQVPRHHVEAEEVAVDAGAGHGQAIHVLVLLGRQPEEPLALGSLRGQPASGVGARHPQPVTPGGCVWGEGSLGGLRWGNGPAALGRWS